MIKKGDIIIIKPEWRNARNARVTWVEPAMMKSVVGSIFRLWSWPTWTSGRRRSSAPT
jgi:hypothetical protein